LALAPICQFWLATTSKSFSIKAWKVSFADQIQTNLPMEDYQPTIRRKHNAQNIAHFQFIPRSRVGFAQKKKICMSKQILPGCNEVSN
jgi:hypothetical protein